MITTRICRSLAIASLALLPLFGAQPAFAGTDANLCFFRATGTDTDGDRVFVYAISYPDSSPASCNGLAVSPNWETQPVDLSMADKFMCHLGPGPDVAVDIFFTSPESLGVRDLDNPFDQDLLLRSSFSAGWALGYCINQQQKGRQVTWRGSR